MVLEVITSMASVLYGEQVTIRGIPLIFLEHAVARVPLSGRQVDFDESAQLVKGIIGDILPHWFPKYCL